MESSSELFSKEQWLVKALSKAKPAAAEKKLLTRRRKLAERHSFLRSQSSRRAVDEAKQQSKCGEVIKQKSHV
jgi:hypothetical protein